MVFNNMRKSRPIYKSKNSPLGHLKTASEMLNVLRENDFPRFPRNLHHQLNTVLCTFIRVFIIWNVFFLAKHVRVIYIILKLKDIRDLNSKPVHIIREVFLWNTLPDEIVNLQSSHEFKLINYRTIAIGTLFLIES